MTYLIAAILLILVLILKSPKVKGMIGESSVKHQLKKLNLTYYKPLHDVMITQPDGKTTQIDHVVISKFGIFVIETKNYKGWIIGGEHAKYWTQVIYKRKEKFFNPIRQNYGHIKALESYLEDATIPFYSIVVFSTRAELKLEPMKTDVISSPNLLSTIEKYKTPYLTDEKVHHIYELLSNRMIHARRERKKHINDIKMKLTQDQNKVAQGICPKCDGRLVIRHGKRGTFHGCSNFPSCRFTKSA